jgi:hypothetical protein
VQKRPRVIDRRRVEKKLGIAILVPRVGNPAAGNLKIVKALIHLLNPKSLEIILHGKESRSYQSEEGRNTKKNDKNNEKIFFLD